MKIFISILLMMFFTYNQVFAIAPLNEQTITAAQKYGIDNSKINLGLFEMFLIPRIITITAAFALALLLHLKD